MEIKTIKIGSLFDDINNNPNRLTLMMLKRAGFNAELIEIDKTIFYDKKVRWSFLATSDLDVIMLPLSLPYFTSLKIIEDIHLLKSPIFTVLISETHAPSFLLNELFDYFTSGLLSPEILINLLKKTPKRISSKNKLDSLVAAVLATAHCFHQKYGGQHGINIPTKFETYKNIEINEVKDINKEIETPISVFISYSHNDVEYKNKFIKHLSLLKQQGIIKIWHDNMIKAGDNWEDEININLVESEIIVFLVSSSFISSYYCYDKEVKKAFSLLVERSNNLKIIPVLVEPTDLEDSQFSKLQIIPRGKKAITTWHNEDEGWVEVVKEIRKVAIEIKEAFESQKRFYFNRK